MVKAFYLFFIFLLSEDQLYDAGFWLNFDGRVGAGRRCEFPAVVGSSSEREVLRCLWSSCGGKEEREEHLVLGLLS